MFSTWILSGKDIVSAISALTGAEFTEQYFLRVGERIWNLQKLFNLKAGLTHADYSHPIRFSREPLSEGYAARRVWDGEKILDEYYQERGWDENGLPREDKL